MTTRDCIIEIEKQFKLHLQKIGQKYAILRPIEAYDNVDFEEVAKHFDTKNIHSYNQGNKIVIEA